MLSLDMRVSARIASLTTSTYYQVFAATLFLSAFLLFSIQPMFTKFVLPVLGGTPAVWSVAMVFFQALLLAGYVYAHFLTRYVPRRLAVFLHLLVTALAFATLPFGLDPGVSEPPAQGEAWWLIKVFLASIGLPFFTLSANGPLLQAWAAPLAEQKGLNVYRLYGVSNAGSFLALFGYLAVLEPLLTLSQQSEVWRLGFALLFLGLGLCALLAAPYLPTAAAQRDEAPPIALTRKLHWIALAAIPSGLLVAVTSYIQTDVASFPFLWVVPLSIFLLSFILAFRSQSGGIERIWNLAQVMSVAVALLSTLPFPYNMVALPFWLQMAAALVALLSTAMVCHGALYGLRPTVGRLTDFYVCLSIGGVLGGLFAGLIAPFIFNQVTEYPLLLVAGLLARPQLWEATTPKKHIVTQLVLVFCVTWGVFLLLPAGSGLNYSLALVACFIAMLLARHAAQSVARIGVVMCAVLLSAQWQGEGDVRRGFFGVVRVIDMEGGALRTMVHGTTLHGAMRRSEAGPQAKPTPLSYYAADGALAGALNLARLDSSGVSVRAGVVGLGVGSMACHARLGDRWTFFEIDPIVIDIAQDAGKFTFLTRCGAGMRIRQGDARLKLRREPDKSFDYLLIDAFSSDSIPTHLLTVEAVRDYLRTVSNKGVLVFHISNRHLDLAPILSRAAAELKVSAFVKRKRYSEREVAQFKTANDAVILLRDPQLAKMAIARGWKPLPVDLNEALWTDDYVNLLGALGRKWAKTLNLP